MSSASNCATVTTLSPTISWSGDFFRCRRDTESRTSWPAHILTGHAPRVKIVTPPRVPVIMPCTPIRYDADTFRLLTKWHHAHSMTGTTDCRGCLPIWRMLNVPTMNSRDQSLTRRRTEPDVLSPRETRLCSCNDENAGPCLNGVSVVEMRRFCQSAELHEVMRDPNLSGQCVTKCFDLCP
jgi:hypothetical protein